MKKLACLDGDHAEELAPVGTHPVPRPLVHEAERTVSGEEQLLAMAHQVAQDSKCLILSLKYPRPAQSTGTGSRSHSCLKWRPSHPCRGVLGQ